MIQTETSAEMVRRDPTGLLARLRAANAGKPIGDWQRENWKRWRSTNPNRLAPFTTTDTVPLFGDTSEDAEPVEPVKRDDGLLTLDQAAAYLNITDEQVAAFIKDGTLDFIN